MFDHWYMELVLWMNCVLVYFALGHERFALLYVNCVLVHIALGSNVGQATSQHERLTMKVVVFMKQL